MLLLMLMALSLSGCAVVEYQKKWFDRDEDGVANKLDKCPGTVPGNVVNRRGCDLFVGVLDGVEFSTDAIVFNAESREALNELALGLNQNSRVVIGVHAHTDNRGKADANLELSKRRVMQVVRYLLGKGVDARQLRPYGYGESRPIVSNSTAKGRLQNRRIELVLLN